MSASRLKVLALGVWASIILAGIVLVIFLAANADLLIRPQPGSGGPAAALQSNPTNPPPQFPTWTPTPNRQAVYLPSATARPVSPTPTQPTNTPVTPLTSSQYYPVDNGNPLTGQSADPRLLDRRPVAVKISTFPRGVREYQSGLTLADVAYEYYIEDGLTRFVAVFYSQDANRAGPVRSGRYFDEHIMRMYHSVLVFANADERVENYLVNMAELRPLLFVLRPDNCPPMCRDDSIRGYNNVFVDTAGVGAKISDNSKQELRETLFGPLLSATTFPIVNWIYTHYSQYSYGYWEYDPARQLYWRFSDKQDASSFTVGEVYQPHIDNLNNKQVSAQNVVVLVVPHNFNNEYDREDQVFNIQLLGSGTAYIFREGRMLIGAWRRDLFNQPIQLVDEQAKPIALQPGVTFYQVINPQSTFRHNGETVEFFFSIPPRHVTATPAPFGFKPSPTPKNKK